MKHFDRLKLIQYVLKKNRISIYCIFYKIYKNTHDIYIYIYIYIICKHGHKNIHTHTQIYIHTRMHI